MHEPSLQTCPECGGTLSKLGEDVSEVLDYIPASFVVIRHVRPKLSCCGCDAIVQSPAPSRPIERGLAGPGLLAHVLTAKYCDHLPLYRQHEIYAREGIDIDRSTLANWVGESSSLLEPLVLALRRYVLAASKVHGDDTPVPVLAPGQGKTKTGRLWTYVRDDRPAGIEELRLSGLLTRQIAVANIRNSICASSANIASRRVCRFNQIYESGRVQEAACWAHVRRKFYDLKQAHNSPIAGEAVGRIGELYGIEKEIRGRPPEQRREVRNARTRPLLDSMHQWAEASLSKLSKKSDTSAAIRYALGLWDALVRFCDDGHIEIDNSAAERALRAVAIGRKNYLFAGSDSGGERAAAIYSLAGSQIERTRSRG